LKKKKKKMRSPLVMCFCLGIGKKKYNLLLRPPTKKRI